MSNSENCDNINLSGVYKIVNVSNNKCYVGSAKNFRIRWNRHSKDLENGTHCNIKLQKSYNKYGKDNFVFIIIELVPYEPEFIIEREDYWIKLLNSKSNGYNISDASFGDTLSNHPLKKEIILKISNSMKKSYNLMTNDEIKRKCSKPNELNGMYGKNHTEDSKNKIRDSNINTVFINKNGIDKRIKKEYVDTYLNDGWVIGLCYVMPIDKRVKISEFAKTRTGDKNSFYGKHHTKESKEKMSSAKREASIPPHELKITINETDYNSCYEASTVLGICPKILYFRIKSHDIKYINYNYFGESKDVNKLYKTPVNNLGRIVSVNGIIYKSITEASLETKIKSLKHKLNSNSMVYIDIFYADTPKNIDELKYPETSCKFYIKYNGDVYHKGIGINKSPEEIIELIKQGDAKMSEFDNI